MISEKENKRISKFLSLILRHKPTEIGIELDENGWTDVQTLIDKSNRVGISINLEILKHIVDTNSKKRFAFNDTLEKIRANQGHSVEIELNYIAQEPPNILYHGTAKKYAESIIGSGIQKQKRHHVHLSAEIESAIEVGRRHGNPIVFEIQSGAMYRANFQFFLTHNGVWLTDNVPAKYLKKMEKSTLH